MDFFLSVYRKDYVPQNITKIQKYVTKQEFEDPMGESFKQYLKLKTETLKPKEEYQQDYMKTVQDKYPEIYKKYFSVPIDINLVKRNLNLEKQSVYQSDYCDMEKHWEEIRDAKHKAEEVNLPADWIIPLTTTAFVYRDPTILKKDALKVVPPIVPERTSFGMSKHVQDILNIKTGKSEYEGVIGKLGGLVIEEEMHGKVIHPPCGCAKHARIVKENEK